MKKLKELLSKWKVHISVVGGALVIATAYGQCTVEPDLDVLEESAVEATETSVSTDESTTATASDETATASDETVTASDNDAASTSTSETTAESHDD